MFRTEQQWNIMESIGILWNIVEYYGFQCMEYPLESIGILFGSQEPSCLRGRFSLRDLYEQSGSEISWAKDVHEVIVEEVVQISSGKRLHNYGNHHAING